MVRREFILWGPDTRRQAIDLMHFTKVHVVTAAGRPR
jgi:hypothetical protein